MTSASVDTSSSAWRTARSRRPCPWGAGSPLTSASTTRSTPRSAATCGETAVRLAVRRPGGQSRLSWSGEADEAGMGADGATAEYASRDVMTALSSLLADLASGQLDLVDLTAPLSEHTPVIQLPPPLVN